jgi:hypothetical protein
VRYIPDGRQRPSPENEETDKVSSVRPRPRHGIVELIERRPDGLDHQHDTSTSNPRLHAIPDTGHNCTVEDRPQRAPYAKGSPCQDGKRDVIRCADAARQADEAGGEEIADPDAEPLETCVSPCWNDREVHREQAEHSVGKLTACHHARPFCVIIVLAIIHVLILNESATQKAGEYVSDMDPAGSDERVRTHRQSSSFPIFDVLPLRASNHDL